MGAKWALLLFVADALLSRRSVSHAKTHTKTHDSIDKVIDVLKGMLVNFNTQSSEDKTNWEDYQKWNDGEEKDRNSFIQEQEGVVMSSTAQLNANKQQVQTLTGQIGDLTGEIAETQSSISELIRLRQDEHKAHQEEVADLTHTLEAVNKAVEVLEGHYAASGASMSQIKQEVTQALSALALSRASDPKMSTVTQFLQDPDWLSVDGGSAYGEYKGVASESGGVIGTLKTIRTTLMDNKQGSIEKENESRRQYEVAKGAKEDELKRSQDEKAAKETALEDAKAKIEHYTAVISQAQTDIGEAQTYVAKLKEDRALFSKEYDNRVAMRSSEQAATQAALDALQEVTAGAKSTVEALMQTAVAHGVTCSRCAGMVQKLFRIGAEMHSQALVQVGTALEAQLRGQQRYDPAAMDPVKNLLHELIRRLEDELAAETSHHEWCETEKATSAAAKAERESNIESLTAEIESLNTAIAQLGSEIAFLGSELIRIARETDTATRLRKEEHEAFVKAKADHDEVIAALDKAMTALGGQYSFAQLRSVAHARQSPFASYSSGNASGGSALQMLQDLVNRYSSARTQLVQDEEAAAKAHADLLAHNEQFRKDTTQTKQAKETEKRQKNERLGNARIELAANREELAQVVQYIADLRPSCDDIRVSFEERKKRREAEIAALKETLAVLEDPSMMG